MAGVWRRNSVTIPMHEKHFASLKHLLDEVNAEEQGCTRKGLPGACGSEGGGGPGVERSPRPSLSPSGARQNFEFANYILSKLDA